MSMGQSMNWSLAPLKSLKSRLLKGWPQVHAIVEVTCELHVGQGRQGCQDRIFSFQQRVWPCWATFLSGFSCLHRAHAAIWLNARWTPVHCLSLANISSTFRLYETSLLLKSHNDRSMAPVSLPRACASCQCHLGQASLQIAMYLRRWKLKLANSCVAGVTGAQGPNKKTRTSPGGRETCSCKTATSAASEELSATTLDTSSMTSAACISLHKINGRSSVHEHARLRNSFLNIMNVMAFMALPTFHSAMSTLRTSRTSGSGDGV